MGDGSEKIFSTLSIISKLYWLNNTLRILLSNKNNGSRFFYNKNEVAEISELISDKERKAEKITKEAEKFLKCKCAENYIGEKFEGTIVSVFDFGFFVKIHKLNIDGFCHINSFKGTKRIRFKLDETIQALIGKKENYFVGDSIKVEITSVDIFRKRIDLKKYWKKELLPQPI